MNWHLVKGRTFSPYTAGLRDLPGGEGQKTVSRAGARRLRQLSSPDVPSPDRHFWTMYPVHHLRGPIILTARNIDRGPRNTTLMPVGGCGRPLTILLITALSGHYYHSFQDGRKRDSFLCYLPIPNTPCHPSLDTYQPGHPGEEGKHARDCCLRGNLSDPYPVAMP